MTDWHKISKIADAEPMDFGNSTVFPVLPRGADLGVSIGFSEFVPGSSEIDVPAPECFLVCEGELEISSGGETWVIARGEAIWMPAGSKVVATAHQPCRVVYAILLR